MFKSPLIKIIFLLVLTGAFWCFSNTDKSSESFLMPTERRERKKTASQLKQQIVEIMGDLIMDESSATKANAEMQLELCKYLQSYAKTVNTGSSKKGDFFSRASVRDLHKMLKLLTREKERQEREEIERNKFLAALRSL